MADEKLFTQEEVNAIVSRRLSEQKISMSKEIADREKAIEDRERQITIREKLKAKGLPEDLADMIKFDNADSLDETIEALSGITKGENTLEIEEKRLPEGDHGNARDRLRDAFGLE